MKTNLQAERLTEDDPLTLKEQQQLLDDLLMVEALVVAYEHYVAKIGKKEEAKEYVRKFMEKLTNEELKKHFIGGEA